MVDLHAEEDSSRTKSNNDYMKVNGSMVICSTVLGAVDGIHWSKAFPVANFLELNAPNCPSTQLFHLFSGANSIKNLNLGQSDAKSLKYIFHF